MYGPVVGMLQTGAGPLTGDYKPLLYGPNRQPKEEDRIRSIRSRNGSNIKVILLSLLQPMERDGTSPVVLFPLAEWSCPSHGRSNKDRIDLGDLILLRGFSPFQPASHKTSF